MKKLWMLGATLMLSLVLTACGDKEEAQPVEEPKEEVKEEVVQPTEQTISYLGADYTVTVPAESIVAASLEAMEDAAILGIKPTGVLEIAGAIPTYLADELAGAALIGDKRTPNAEAILALDPDVIVGTSKWGEDVMSQMNKISTTLPYSHISANWKENLVALGTIAGKLDEANQIIADYDKKATEAKTQVQEKLSDEEVLIIRIRSGLMNIYPADVYLNPVLYADLGLKVPEVVAGVTAQAELTLETLASLNPDAIFIQFDTSENKDAATALDDLLKNPVFANLDATKNSKVFVNAVDPLAQGGTGWSKIKFLDAAVQNLLK